MTAYLGDYLDGKTVHGKWNSFAVAGESVTRATNGEVRAYKNNSTSYTTTGITDTEDFNSLTGVHHFAIDTSASTAFYTPAADYQVVLAGSTIDGKAINACLGHFSIRNRSNMTIIDRNTAQASTVTSTILASASNFTNDDALNGAIISFINGTGKGQSTNVTDFTNSSDTAVHPTVAAAATTTTIYEVLPFGMNGAAVDANGRVDVIKIAGTTQTARDLGASVLLSPGTGTGQISLSSGTVTAGTVSDKTGYSLSSSQTFNVTGNRTGNVTGSVGSVTGAVGSVTGNVGGNVTGSVGSVTASVTVGALTTTAIASIHTTAMAELYGTDGGTVGLAHGIYEILALLGDFGISGTTLTTKKRDGSTNAATYTLNSSTSPTSITRAS